MSVSNLIPNLGYSGITLYSDRAGWYFTRIDASRVALGAFSARISASGCGTTGIQQGLLNAALHADLHFPLACGWPAPIPGETIQICDGSKTIDGDDDNGDDGNDDDPSSYDDGVFSVTVTSEECIQRAASADDIVNVIRVAGTVSGPLDTGLDSATSHTYGDHVGLAQCGDWSYCFRDPGEPASTDFEFSVLADGGWYLDQDNLDEFLFIEETEYSITLIREYVDGYSDNIDIDYLYRGCLRDDSPRPE